MVLDPEEFENFLFARPSQNSQSNIGKLLRDLHMPDYREYGTEAGKRGQLGKGDTHMLGPFVNGHDESSKYSIKPPADIT